MPFELLLVDSRIVGMPQYAQYPVQHGLRLRREHQEQRLQKDFRKLQSQPPPWSFRTQYATKRVYCKWVPPHIKHGLLQVNALWKLERPRQTACRQKIDKGLGHGVPGRIQSNITGTGNY